MKTKAIHIIEDCHGRVWIQKQRRWRSAAYKGRRAFRKFASAARAAEVNPDFQREAARLWDLSIRYGYKPNTTETL